MFAYDETFKCSGSHKSRSTADPLAETEEPTRENARTEILDAIDIISKVDIVDPNLDNARTLIELPI
jgi:hypothetical protein